MADGEAEPLLVSLSLLFYTLHGASVLPNQLPEQE